MLKQDYITYKLLDRTINVKASCKVHRAAYDRLTEVLEKLNKLHDGGEINSAFAGAFFCVDLLPVVVFCGEKQKKFSKSLDEKGENG